MKQRDYPLRKIRPLMAVAILMQSGQSLPQSAVLHPYAVQHDVTVHRAPDKRKVPDAERLAYAERLYASNKFDAVKAVTAELLKEVSLLAPDAQFLRGKAMFALGEIEPTRQAYEWIVLRHHYLAGNWPTGIGSKVVGSKL